MANEPNNVSHQLTTKEFGRAVALANRVLDRPNGDPDDDLAVLARQFLRAVERAQGVPTPTGESEQMSHSEPDYGFLRIIREKDGYARITVRSPGSTSESSVSLPWENWLQLRETGL